MDTLGFGYSGYADLGVGTSDNWDTGCRQGWSSEVRAGQLVSVPCFHDKSGNCCVWTFCSLWWGRECQVAVAGSIGSRAACADLDADTIRIIL